MTTHSAWRRAFAFAIVLGLASIGSGLFLSNLSVLLLVIVGVVTGAVVMGIMALLQYLEQH